MVDGEFKKLCRRCGKLQEEVESDPTHLCGLHVRHRRWLYLAHSLAMFGCMACIAFGGGAGGGPPIKRSSIPPVPVDLSFWNLFIFKAAWGELVGF